MSPIPNLPDNTDNVRVPSQNPNARSSSRQESGGLPGEDDDPIPQDDDGTSGDSSEQLPTSGSQDSTDGPNDSGPGVVKEEEPRNEWDVSNQLPEVQKSRTSSSDERQQVPEAESEQTQEDDELNRTLSDIDGEIMADREEERAKNDEQAVGILADVIPQQREGDASTNDSGDQETVGGTSTEAIPGEHEARKSTGIGDEVPTPRILTNADDGPDAKDDDVIARQLREAAMAETDPELKESLWDEYRRYKAKFK